MVNSHHCQLLQEDLNAVVSWAKNLGLEFNVQKCHTMSFYKTSNTIYFVYDIYNTPLSSAGDKVIDFGVIFDCALNLHEFIEATCCRALKMLGFVKRTCNEFNLVNSLKILYCVFVRSILEYCSVVWDPTVK